MNPYFDPSKKHHWPEGFQNRGGDFTPRNLAEVLRCGQCGHDWLLAFSCKRRGFCPSCGARRMAQTAAHLVEHVIPQVPVRQWVLSLPIPLRLLLAAQPELVQRVITGHLLDALAMARRCNWTTRYPTPANDSLRCTRAGQWPRMRFWAE